MANREERIAAAREHYETRAQRRPKQVWDWACLWWVKVSTDDDASTTVGA